MYEIQHIKLYLEANDLDGLKAYLKSEHSRKTLKLESILTIIDDVKSFETALCLLEYAIKLNKLTYSELLIHINKTELEQDLKHQLVSNLFAYAVLNEEFTVAESFLQKLDRKDSEYYDKQQWNLHLLNRVNSADVPLLQQCFLANPKNDAPLKFLIEQGCNINQTDSQNRTLADLASTQHQQYIKLLEYIVQKGGDWRPYSGYLFEHINRKANIADISRVLSISGHLLHLNNNNQTVFQVVIARNDFATLRLLLAHVQELVIAKAQVAERNTRLPVEQLRECSFILEHCLNIYKDSNEEIKNIFREYNLHLLAAAPFEIHMQQPFSQEQLLFSQGLLNFLSEYQGRKLRPLYIPSLKTIAHQATRFLSLQDRMQYIATYPMADFNRKSILSHDNGAYLQHRADQKEQAGIEEVRRNDATIEQHLQEYFNEKEAQQRQQEQQLAKEQEHQQLVAQANIMLGNNLENIPAKINEILACLTAIINERDKEKIKHQRIDWIFSSATFITAIAFFISASVNSDEPGDKFSNLDCGAIALAVHWAICFTLGAFDLEENYLRLNDLAPELRGQVTNLYNELKYFQLANNIGNDNPNVYDIVQSLWNAHRQCQSKLVKIQALNMQAEVNIPQTLAQPKLYNYMWESTNRNNNDPTTYFCTYLCFVGIEGGASLIGCYSYHNIKSDLEDSSEEYGLDPSALNTPHTVCFKLGGFVAIQLGLFPAYWLGRGFYCLGQGTGKMTKECLTRLWQNSIRPTQNNPIGLRQGLLEDIGMIELSLN